VNSVPEGGFDLLRQPGGLSQGIKMMGPAAFPGCVCGYAMSAESSEAALARKFAYPKALGAVTLLGQEPVFMRAVSQQTLV